MNPFSISIRRTWLVVGLMFGLFVIVMVFPAISFHPNVRAGVSVTPALITGAEFESGQAVADDLSLLDARLTNCLGKLEGISASVSNMLPDIKARIARLQERLYLLMNRPQSVEPANKRALENRNHFHLLQESARLRKELTSIEKLVGQKASGDSRLQVHPLGKLAPVVTGAISGTVTDAATSSPIAGISVQIFDANDAFITSAVSNGSGIYTTPATLATGTYYAFTANGLGYLNKVYNNIACTNCDPLSGTPISVTSGSTTTGINFALTLGGKISGNIKDAGTMANLQNITVNVYDSGGQLITSVPTDPTGNYTTNTGLQTGTYYARTNNNAGYINQLYNSAACVVCTLAVGTPISVTAGATTSGINFALTPGGRISGTVTNAATSAPISGVQVQIIHPSGTVLANATTNGAGVYTCPIGLTTGSYYVRTTSSVGFLNQIYNGIACQGCTPVLGTAVPVTTGATTTGINFALTAGGRISGTVTDAVTSAPIPGVSVQITNSGGVVVTGIGTDGSGNYISRIGLPTGIYYVQTVFSDYVDKVYNDTNCQGCDVTRGTPISVTAGATTSAINFSLSTGGSISGRITNAANSAPLANVEVDIYTPCQGIVTAAITDGLGNYTTPNSLPTGTYYAVTANSEGFIEKVYDNSPTCPVCDPTLGTPIAVTSGATTTAINFALSMGARISGVTADATNSIPITSAPNIFDANGNLVSQGFTTVFGNYFMPSGLPSGTYYVRSNNSAGYINKLYNNTACAPCPPTSGTPITLTAGTITPGINFSLDPGGRIVGTITNAATAAPLPGFFVTLYDASGTVVTSATTDTYGNYISGRGVPTGNYYAVTFNLQGFINKAYNNTVCAGCVPTSTTPIAMSNGVITTGINFALSSGGGRISGTVTSAATAAPLPNVIVNFYTAGGAQATNTITDCSGNFTCDDGLPTGNYFVRTANTRGFVDQLYSNINCINCDPTTGTSVPVTIGSTTPGINLSLCQMTLASKSAYFGVNGDEASFNLITSSGCSWTAMSNNSWIELVSASSGMGSATITYVVRDNFTFVPRQGTISVAGQTFTITQDSQTGPDCTFTLTPAFTAFSGSGGTGSISVSAEERCAWQSMSNVNWITVTSNCCGIGNGEVTYTVAPNPGSTGRAGVITVAGKSFNVKQKGH